MTALSNAPSSLEGESSQRAKKFASGACEEQALQRVDVETSPPTTPSLDRPIVIVGAPRSGTSILGRLLSCHGALAYIEEPRLIWRYGNDHKSDMLTAEDARPDVCQYIRSRFARDISSAGKRRMVEKTPSNSLRLDFVNRVLPGCLVVHVTRDATESVLAIQTFWQDHAQGLPSSKLLQRLREVRLKQLPYYGREVIRRAMPRRLSGLVRKPVWGPRIPGIDGLLQDLELIEVCAIQWRMCVEAARHFGRTMPSNRYMEFRLEDLTPELMKEILRFCQLDDSLEVRQAFKREFDSTQVSHRRAAATADQIAIIERWTEPTSQWLKYSD